MTDRLVNADTLAAALLSSDLIRRYEKYAHDAHPVTMAPWPSGARLADDWAAAILAAIPPDPRLDALLALVRETHLRAWAFADGTPMGLLALEDADVPEGALAICATDGEAWPCRTRDALAAFEEQR